ncbi:BspA family leucine-rich repeat surface protein [Clostridioides difficile]|nr:BspA family leucine-rich repeat surface protein [Clostridioides difficile]MCA0538677.1 BspA family leucine-rich repeat surface protein [Clostridioides difficile]MCA0729622.1 BspA family leucine-rich repeat surface protein [Clostridioides difficile]MCR1511898.1 BspA family leucine-rich repeat surface protein [Clostridioides difficile]MDN9631326.1 BspA family leucine-rich repeat surface protein [Clostridioides difficile]
MKTKIIAITLVAIIGTSTLLSGMPTTVFAQENMEIVNENITDNTNEATKSGEETNIDENTDIVVEDVSPSTENSIVDEQPVISEEKETQTSEKSEIKATAVKVSNGIEKSDWNIVSETDTEIVLGEYIGSSKDIVVPSEIDGKQVFIDKFKTKLSPEVTSVIFLSQNGKKTKIKGDFSQFFYRYEDLKKVDFNGLDLSNVTSLNHLFGSCSSLTEINGLDNLDISNINDISFMFSGCTSLKNIEFLKNWDVSNLKNFEGLFFECESLEDLTPLKSWNTSKAEKFDYMFGYCKSLRDITPIQNWDVSNVISMTAMFRQCSSLKNIDLSMWNPISLERADMLFEGIGKISDTLFVNLSQWNLENVNIENIFHGLGNSSYKILVVTDDEKLKNYDYEGRYMSGNSMTFFATGGKFDTNIERKVSTPIYTIPDTSDSTVNSIVENIKKEIGIPIKEGYQFIGWSSNVADTNNIVELLNQVFNANWKINTYKVDFESQGGSKVIGQTVEVNGLIQQPIAPVKPGFTFLGWYNEAECLTKWNFQTDRMPADNLILYAKWGLNTIEINHIPMINATDKVLTVGDTFNPLDGVTAFDDEDGAIALTEANIIANDVNMDKAGTYNITYKVTDSQGATVVKTITVVVNPKMEELNHVPTINATDKVLTVGDTFNPLEGVTASDKEDGDITEKVEVLSNDVDTSKAGTYTVIYKVTDSKGASSTKTITVTVKGKDTQKPTIDDNKKPSATDTDKKPASTDKQTTSNSPETGDSTNMTTWLALMFVSLSLLTGVFIVRKSRKSI